MDDPFRFMPILVGLVWFRYFFSWWFGLDWIGLDLDLNPSLVLIESKWDTTPEPPNYQSKPPSSGKLMVWCCRFVVGRLGQESIPCPKSESRASLVC